MALIFIVLSLMANVNETEVEDFSLKFAPNDISIVEIIDFFDD